MRRVLMMVVLSACGRSGDCPDGFVMESGECVPAVEGACPPGQVVDGSGECVEPGSDDDVESSPTNDTTTDDSDSDTTSPYTGGWPYNPDKDELEDPGTTGRLALGVPFPRVVGTDQYGDAVDLYDFVGHDRKIVVFLAAMWSASSQDLASWLTGGRADPDLQDRFGDLPALYADNEIEIVTFLIEDLDSEQADPMHAVEWNDAYPAELAVLTEVDPVLPVYCNVVDYPWLILIDDERLVLSNNGTFWHMVP